MKKILGPIILGISGVAMLTWLMIWQLDRLEWKRELINALSAQMNGETKTIGDLAYMDLSKIDGQPFVAEGVIGESFTDLLSGNKDGAGYRRIVPLVSEGSIIMVELGFLREDQKELDFGLSGKTLKVEGHLYAPKGQGIFDESRNIWIGYDLEKMSEQLGAMPLILVATTSPIAEIKSAPYTISLPNNHLQYAITWGLLALAWLGMSVYWGYRKLKTEI